MAGYVTNTRPKVTVRSGLVVRNGVTTWNSPFAYITGAETVYSWRTIDDVVPSEDRKTEDIILSSAPTGQRYAALRSEYKRNEKSSPYDTGHAFYSQKTFVEELPFRKVNWTSPAGNRYSYEGSLADISVTNANAFSSRPASNEAYYGPLMISLTKPTSPHADLVLGLAELMREGAPSAPGAQTMQSRNRSLLNSGSEYLNVEFGWKPLIKDVKSVFEAVSQSGKILRNFQRDSGRPVRRNLSFPDIIDTTTSTTTGTLSPNISGLGLSEHGSFWKTGALNSINRSCSVLETITRTTKVSFSGQYMYHIQSKGSILDNVLHYEQLANHLLGTRLNPEVLWNLAPWTWLSDWNWNIGRNISNASALTSDGLVLRYGFLMIETRSVRTRVCSGPILANGDSGPWTFTYVNYRKERFKASPYGFSSNPNSYTSRQWAILGALGLTKADKILH